MDGKELEQGIRSGVKSVCYAFLIIAVTLNLAVGLKIEKFCS